MIGYAMCGSFCTLSDSIAQLSALVAAGYEVQPILSERVYNTDTRFFTAAELCSRIINVCGRRIIHTVEGAEPFGQNRLDELIIAPCTGNTLAKLANGITDSAVTMAAKAHLRCDGRLLIALASNDAMSQNLRNISAMLQRKSVYFVPLRQDNPTGKPHSLVADFSRLSESLDAMREGRQIRPLFI